MNQKDNFKSALPMAALDEIPQPSENAKEIVGLVKAQGKVTGYKLSDGQMVSKSEGVAMAKAGDTVTIQKITGRDEVRLHLAELGFVVDSEVTVVNEIAGNLIIQVKESRIALDKTMANRIMIG